MILKNINKNFLSVFMTQQADAWWSAGGIGANMQFESRPHY